MSDVKVSVICITYNHAPFIRDALDGFVMQKTNFPYEVIIHDDASTDGTADIIREYAEKYPDIIKPILQTENQWSRGISISRNYTWPRIRGQYVALCEGDDYWTDENKLQRQSDFLDTHPDFSICFHPVVKRWQDASKPDTIFPSAKEHFYKNTLDINHLKRRNFIATGSVMYRWCLNNDYDRCPSGITPGDWYLHLLHAQHGKIYMLPSVMGVYRKHSGGIWIGADGTDDFYIKNGVPFIRFYRHFDQEFGDDHHVAIQDIMRQTIDASLRTRNYSVLTRLSSEFPELYNMMVRVPLGDGLRAYRSFRKYKLLFKILLILFLCAILFIFLFAYDVL